MALYNIIKLKIDVVSILMIFYKMHHGLSLSNSYELISYYMKLQNTFSDKRL